MKHQPPDSMGQSAGRVQQVVAGKQYPGCTIKRYQRSHFEVELGHGGGTRWLYVPDWRGFGYSALDVASHLAGAENYTGSNGLGTWESRNAFSGPLRLIADLQKMVQFQSVSRDGGPGTAHTEHSAEVNVLGLDAGFVAARATGMAFTGLHGGGLAVGLDLKAAVSLEDLLTGMLRMFRDKKLKEKTLELRMRELEKSHPVIVAAVKAMSDCFKFSLEGRLGLMLGLARDSRSPVPDTPYLRIVTTRSAAFKIKTGVPAIDEHMERFGVSGRFDGSWQINLKEGRSHFMHFLH